MSIISNRYLGEGVITKGTLTAVAAYAMPKILKIPFIPPVVSAAAATGLSYAGFYGGQAIIDQVAPLLFSSAKVILETEAPIYLKFLPVIGVTLCALLYKRGGKVFSKGGFASLKEYIIPVGVKEESLITFKNRVFTFINYCSTHKEANDDIELAGFVENLEEDKQYKEVKVIDLENIEGTASATVPVQLVITSFDRDMYYNFRIDGEDFGTPVRMANVVDDDDDDDDSGVEKLEKKKDKPSANELLFKKGCLYLGSGGATILSKYFTGEGLTTTALNAIFTASVKAEFRQQPILNSIGYLTLASGVLLTVKICRPDSMIGDLMFMPVSTLVSLGNKYFKDRITGKRLKNENFYEVPLFIQKIAKKYFSFEPDQLIVCEHPMKSILEDEKGKLTLTFNANDIHDENEDLEIQAKVKFESEKFSGKYVGLTEKDLKKLHLARLKGEKIGKWAEVTFISIGVLATFGASYSTKQINLMNVTHAVQIPAEKLGEGVVTSIFNSVIATQMKQMGKQIPPFLRYGGGGLAWVSAVTLERVLLAQDKLPFLFAGVFASAFMGPMGKHSKDWVFGKIYGKTPGYITTNWPTDEDIEEQKKKILVCCGLEENPVETIEVLEEVPVETMEVLEEVI
jgi:hypothetical protein